VSGLLLAMVLTVGYATEIHELPELLGDAVNERITLLARFAHVAPDTAVVMLLLMPLMAICSLSPAVTVLEQARCGRALARSTRLVSGRRLAAVAIGYAAFLVVPFVERLFINILMPVVRPISEQVPGEMAIKVVWLPGLFVEVFAFCALGCLTVSIHRLKVPLDVVPAGAVISAGQMGAALPVAAAVPVPPPQAVPVASRAAFAATASDDAAPSLFLNTWFQFLLILAIVATAITIYNAVSEGAYGGF